MQWGEVEPAEQVERLTLGSRREQRLMTVLAMEVDERLPEFGQLGGRHRTAVDVGTGTPGRRNNPAEHDLSLADHESAVDARLRRAGTNQHRIGPPAQQQRDGLDDEGLAGTGLAGHCGHPVAQQQGDVLDDAQVAHHQLGQH